MTDSAPTLDQINLVVKDMDATVAFYQRLGVEIPDTEPDWQPHHRSATLPGGLDLSFDSELFAKQWNAGSQPAAGGRAVITFHLDSRDAVDRTYADLTAAGYTGSQEPFDAFWGARYAIVNDPDGNPVGLMSPADEAHRSRPELP